MIRKDATLIKDPDPFHSIVPYVMPKRTEAEVSITEVFDITKLKKYMDTRNKKEKTNLKLFHAICTAVAKTIYHRDKLNIFISGRHYWHRNDISLSFVAKQKLDDESVETLMFLKIKEDMNLDNISREIIGDVKKARDKGTNSLDGTMKFVGKLPRFILEIVFFVVNKLEYFGIMPSSLSEGDPNYSTCLLSNLGSIGSESCYHHLSNYGTNSMMVTIGTMKYNKSSKKYEVKMTFTLDERIADGFYFAKSLKIIKFLLENPKHLYEKISAKIPYEV